SVLLRSKLDFGMRLKDCGCPDILGTPTDIKYDSQTVPSKPIIQVAVTTDAADGVPTQIKGELEYAALAKLTVFFDTTGHSAGDKYLIAMQRSSAITSTGLYPWKMTVTFTLSGGATRSRSVNGTSLVVVNNSPYGTGWSLSGVDKMVSVTGGMLRV